MNDNRNCHKEKYRHWQDDEDEEAEVVTNAEATNEVIDDDEF